MILPVSFFFYSIVATPICLSQYEEASRGTFSRQHCLSLLSIFRFSFFGEYDRDDVFDVRVKVQPYNQILIYCVTM